MLKSGGLSIWLHQPSELCSLVNRADVGNKWLEIKCTLFFAVTFSSADCDDGAGRNLKISHVNMRVCLGGNAF